MWLSRLRSQSSPMLVFQNPGTSPPTPCNYNQRLCVRRRSVGGHRNTRTGIYILTLHLRPESWGELEWWVGPRVISFVRLRGALFQAWTKKRTVDVASLVEHDLAGPLVHIEEREACSRSSNLAHALQQDRILCLTLVKNSLTALLHFSMHDQWRRLPQHPIQKFFSRPAKKEPHAYFCSSTYPSSGLANTRPSSFRLSGRNWKFPFLVGVSLDCRIFSRS